jgi:hypothetical protein
MTAPARQIPGHSSPGRSSARCRRRPGRLAEIPHRNGKRREQAKPKESWAPLNRRAAGQLAELTARAVAVAALEDPLGVTSLLEAGAEEQITKLLDRNPAAALDNQYSVARLLDRLSSPGGRRGFPHDVGDLP